MMSEAAHRSDLDYAAAIFLGGTPASQSRRITGGENERKW